VSVLNFVKCNDNRKFIIGNKLKVVGNLYSNPTYPCASEELGVQIMRENTVVRLWPYDKIRSKMWRMLYTHNEFVVFLIVHT